MAAEQKKEVRNLVVVVLSGIGLAFFVTLMTLNCYGPSGTYIAKNILLEPQLLEKLNYNDTNSKTGGMSRFVFNEIEFSYYDSSQKQWRRIKIPHNLYQQFYTAVANDRSILNFPKEMENKFTQSPSPTLTLSVRTESPAEWQQEVKVFQEVNFLPQDNYFRIQLHEQNKTGNWAYFYRQNIYSEVMHLFVEKP